MTCVCPVQVFVFHEDSEQQVHALDQLQRQQEELGVPDQQRRQGVPGTQMVTEVFPFESAKHGERERERVGGCSEVKARCVSVFQGFEGLVALSGFQGNQHRSNMGEDQRHCSKNHHCVSFSFNCCITATHSKIQPTDVTAGVGVSRLSGRSHTSTAC